MKKVLTIAGSDCSGGAGIQADIKTITAHKLYAMSAITALTAQNTTGVQGVCDTPPEFVAQQLDSIFEDIRPDAVKIGMVSNSDIIETIAERLSFCDAKNIVIDPVMIATSGGKLMKSGATEALIKKLFPLATVITPNILEAEALSETEINSEDDMLKAAKILAASIACGILLKGGHLENSANDLLYQNGTPVWFKGKHIDTKNTHGTGCTLSSAIACNLALGLSLEKSIENAKSYVTGALIAGAKMDIGHGNGPLNHMYL